MTLISVQDLTANMHYPYKNEKLQMEIANLNGKTELDLSNEKFTHQDMEILMKPLRKNKVSSIAIFLSVSASE